MINHIRLFALKHCLIHVIGIVRISSVVSMIFSSLSPSEQRSYKFVCIFSQFSRSISLIRNSLNYLGRRIVVLHDYTLHDCSSLVFLVITVSADHTSCTS